MTTIVSAAVGAIVAALQSAPAVSTAVERVRMRPWAAGQTSAIAVRPVSAERGLSALGNAGPDAWDVLIGVECYARATGSTAPDAGVDALLQAAYTRLMADPTLAGVVRGGLEPKTISFEFDADADKTACAILVLHAHMVGSIALT